jgi:hypothetical protein
MGTNRCNFMRCGQVRSRSSRRLAPLVFGYPGRPSGHPEQFAFGVFACFAGPIGSARCIENPGSAEPLRILLRQVAFVSVGATPFDRLKTACVALTRYAFGPGSSSDSRPASVAFDPGFPACAGTCLDTSLTASGSGHSNRTGLCAASQDEEHFPRPWTSTPS